MKIKNKKLSVISSLHYLKLSYRFVLLVLAVIMYAISKVRNSGEMFRGFEKEYWVLGIIWLVYVVEMACRFFPSRLESMGCQKQFKRNYQPTGKTEPKLQSWKRQIVLFVPIMLLLSISGDVLKVLWTGPISDGGSCIISILVLLFCWKKIFKKPDEDGLKPEGVNEEKTFD